MKNALILHGTGATPDSNWFTWLKDQLEKQGYRVWLPQLPNSDRPNMQTYVKFLLSSDFKFNKDTIIIGHSSGAVATLGLLSKLRTPIKTSYLVSAFKDSLGWDALDDLFTEKIDYKKAGQNAEKIVFLHSDNDPYCPLEHAKHLLKQVDGELVVIKGQGHFNTENSPKYTKFPELLDIMNLRELTLAVSS